MTRPQMSCRTYGALALVAIIALVGCTPAGSSPTRSAAGSASASASASLEPSASASQAASRVPTSSASAAPSEPTDSLPPFACTRSVTIARTTDRAQITDVRVGAQTGYDRIVFEFASGIPQTVIEAVLPPFYKDPSGQEIHVAGTAFLKVIMSGASTVSPNGGITYSGPTNFEPGFGQLVQLIEGGDFEAVSTWFIGLNRGGCIRALTLAAPSRLVIDIQH